MTQTTYRLDIDGRRTESVTVATRAQKKLLQSVFILKWLLISCAHPVRFNTTCRKDTLTSIENSTPPIGEPNATATPAALAAVTISRIFPESIDKRGPAVSREKPHTLAMRKPPEETGYEASDATRNMYGRSFFANRQTRSYDQRLLKSRDTSRGKRRKSPTKVRLFITKVQCPRYPFITNPANIHLISDIPDPAAYFAKDRTRRAAMNENIPYERKNLSSTQVCFLIQEVGRNVQQK